MFKINIVNALMEKKTFRSGGKYRPSVYKMLEELAQEKGISKAEYIEKIIINEYMKKQGDE